MEQRFSSVAEIDPQLRLELRDLAQKIALEAGALVKEIRSGHVEVFATKSTDTDVVTVADTSAEKLIRERLSKARPQDAILGEEGGSTGGTSGLTWVVDPIDGTVNYLHDIPEYAVSIAVVFGPADPATWQVVAGCVFRPEDGKLYTAALGQGAHSGGQKLEVAPPVELHRALVATGFGYDPQLRIGQARVLSGVLPKIADIRRPGSAALDLANLAAGKFDIFYETGLNPWDMAAGELLITEAGGVVTGIGGRKAGIDLTVAGHHENVAQLAEILEQLRADEIGS